MPRVLSAKFWEILEAALLDTATYCVEKLQNLKIPNSRQNRKSCQSQLIPTAHSVDLYSLSLGNGGKPFWLSCKEVPCVCTFIEDVFVAVEDGYREFVGAQVLPDIFHRVELWGIGRQF